jgi:Na+-transporting NADH:ubiquinone oxidoreductase subunit A
VIHRTHRGLDLPITGLPAPQIDDRATARVAVVAADALGLRPTLHVAEGDAVRQGQTLFDDKKTPGVRYTAPASGRIVGVHRGARRALQSVVIDTTDGGDAAPLTFAAFDGRPADALTTEYVRDVLLESGLWPALRARPFSRVADPAVTPRSLFVTATDSEPLAPRPEMIVAGREADFALGLRALSTLTPGPVYVCTSDSWTAPVETGGQVTHARFTGPHPSGTVGYHIHVLDPAGRGRIVWHVGYQDVLAIGHLFATGALDRHRVVALAGPAVARPRLLRVPVGASTDEVVAGELTGEDVRVLSGSVLAGREAEGDVHGFLGRHHRQIAVLAEGRRRDLLGWAGPGVDRFSTLRVFLSTLAPSKRFAFTTSTNGSPRAIIPVGLYERVMPFDLQPTYLLKALVTRDVERAEELGCLELDEEDLALCTFVCPGKNDYGPYLREVLGLIEKEG